MQVIDNRVSGLYPISLLSDDQKVEAEIHMMTSYLEYKSSGGLNSLEKDLTGHPMKLSYFYATEDKRIILNPRLVPCWWNDEGNLVEPAPSLDCRPKKICKLDNSTFFVGENPTTGCQFWRIGSKPGIV